MAPIAPGALAESASAKMRFLYSAEYWRRLALTTPPGAGAVFASLAATLRPPSTLNPGREGVSLILAQRGVPKIRRAYTRTQSFLLSYVLLASGVEKLELLSTQLSLWNTGRAIATAFVISSVEVGVAWF